MFSKLPLLPIILLSQPSNLNPLHIRSALYGGQIPWFPDLYLLSLGMQQQLNPVKLNKGEYPACAAMTTGYIFRVENQATVWFLQKVGKTGYLKTLQVDSSSPQNQQKLRPKSEKSPIIFYSSSAVQFLVMLILPGKIDLNYIISMILILLSRFLNILTLRMKTKSKWHGQSEPDVKGDLLILLSEDRWIRIRGLVDDLKAITSGSWIQHIDNPNIQTFCDMADWMAHILVYVALVILSNATFFAQLVLIGFVTFSHVVMTSSNAYVLKNHGLNMHGRELKVVRERKYTRRLDLAKRLIDEVGNNGDWAVRIGLVNPDEATKSKAEQSVVTM